MTAALKTVIYPVKDLASAKTLYSTLLGVEPMELGRALLRPLQRRRQPGNRLGPQRSQQRYDRTGRLLACRGHQRRPSRSLLAAGATEQQSVSDTGGGKLMAKLTDTDGNVIGLIQVP